MSFQQGLSGLAGASKNLDVIGNNIANVSTAGFKSSRAEFADVYASSLYGTGGVQVGIGTQIVGVAQQFTQGNISITNNPLDVAINGDGFFRLSDSGAVTYTRNGQFHLDKDGFLVTNTGVNVTGYTSLTVDPVTNTVTGAANLGNIQVDLNDLDPQDTTLMTMVMNLDAGENDISATFDPDDPSTYNFTTTATVYDSQGGDHSLTYYFTKTAANTWTVNATIDDTTNAMTLSSSALTFATDGSITPADQSRTLTSPAGWDTALGVDPLSVTLDLTAGTTQFAGNSGVSALSQNGFARGRIVGVAVDAAGVISGRYTNGLSRPLQQLVLANFRNPNALVPLGSNQWAASGESGAEVLNAPGDGVAGAVQAGATEDANVDLTAELVNLIVAQRLYQANAQTIRTQDQILQTLVNLR
jgi:flagellar hook protein FlgE